MRLIIFISLIAGGSFFGCNKHHECDCAKTEDLYLKTTILSTNDMSCNLPVLDFTEDSVRIRNLTNKGIVQYGVINLPANLNTANNKLYVRVALLSPAEEFICNTLGLGYPHLKVIDAQIR